MIHYLKSKRRYGPVWLVRPQIVGVNIRVHLILASLPLLQRNFTAFTPESSTEALEIEASASSGPMTRHTQKVWQNETCCSSVHSFGTYQTA